MARAPTEPVAREIRGDRIEPGRKLLPRVVSGAVLINANETLLGEVFGVAFILQKSNEIVEQTFAVAFHQFVQSIVPTGGQSLHVNRILVITAAAAHRRRPPVIPGCASCVQAGTSSPGPRQGNVGLVPEACFG